MKKLFGIFLLCLFISIPGLSAAQGDRFVFLASTIGPVDAGIVGVLEDEFEKETGVRIRHVSAGTGATLKIAQKGNIDLVIVHAKSLEEKFVQDGYGTERIPLMYNDFVIVGPVGDPAGVKGMKNAAEALKVIAAKGAAFISRGDKSGTHVAEMNIWQTTGMKPSGSWYKIYEKGAEGNASTLRYADGQQAYTLIDRATYLSLKDQIKLAILVEKDQALINYITLIPVNAKKFPRVNEKDVKIFVAWLTAPEKGQKIIRDFGKDKYGSPLFFPNSREWVKLQGGK